MIILLVGKTGVFDTLAVACGCLNKMDITNIPYFGDLGIENSKVLVKIEADNQEMQLYVMGYKDPDIIQTINQELGTLTIINEQDRLRVIPISVKGDTTTWMLSKLANAPVMGKLCLTWAKNRTLNRSNYLLEFGKNLNLENVEFAKEQKDIVFAAKPHVE